MQFRAESFNLSNTPHFVNPNGSANSSNFGKILVDQFVGRAGPFSRIPIRLPFGLLACERRRRIRASTAGIVYYGFNHVRIRKTYRSEYHSAADGSSRCGLRALRAHGKPLFTSGHIAKREGKPWAGKLGAELKTEEGKAAARGIAIDLLGTLHAFTGDLNRIRRIVKLLVLVNSAPTFTEQHLVANGASELFAGGVRRVRTARPQRVRRRADPAGELRGNRSGRGNRVTAVANPSRTATASWMCLPTFRSKAIHWPSSRDASQIDGATMQRIAQELNLSETVFLLPGTASGCRGARPHFHPATEMIFAGHPTIGAAFAPLDEGIVRGGRDRS